MYILSNRYKDSYIKTFETLSPTVTKIEAQNV